MDHRTRLSQRLQSVSCLGFALLCGTGCETARLTQSNFDCVEGEARICTGAKDCQGEQTCQGNPSAFGPCLCDDDAPDASAAKPAIGQACSGDHECPVEAFCLSADSALLFGGGAAHGTCVADCTRDASRCESFLNATCIQVSIDASIPQALCFESCTLSGRNAKCGKRPGLACTRQSVDSQTGYCRPLCTQDAQCAGGSCDPKHGVCVDHAVIDRNFGVRCSAPDDADGGSAGDGGNPDAHGDAAAPSREPCAGQCVQLNGAPSLCSKQCVFGESSECAPSTGGRRRGGCIFASTGGGIGDLGYCAELCDCSDDCVDSTLVCDAFENRDLEAAFGRKGVCTDRSLIGARELACVH